MMIKSVLYLGLYGAIAGTGMFFYNSLDNNEQPIAQIQESVQQLKANLDDKTKPGSGVYRWKNADGVWEYGNQLPEHLKQNIEQVQYDYQKELALLKSLPKEALPLDTKKIENEVRAESVNDNFIIPGIPSMKQVSKLIHDATDIEAKLDQRQQKIDRILEDQ